MVCIHGRSPSVAPTLMTADGPGKEPSMNQERSCRFESRVGWAIALGTLAVGAGMGCEPSNSVKPGAAVMLSFGAVDAASPFQLDPAAPYGMYGAPLYLTPNAT